MTLKIEYTPLLQKTKDCKAKTVVHVGGAGSSKSHSVAQLLILKLCNEEHKKIGICRKTFPSLRMTAMKLVIGLLQDYDRYIIDNHNKTANTYRYGTNEIQFFSLDEWYKVKSVDFNYVWMEEANDFTYEDYTAIKLTLRNPSRDGEANKLYLSLNPTDANGWIPTKLLLEDDVEVIRSTFQDNPFLSKAYIKTITDLIYQDENFYKIYALGEWGLLQRRIYTNFKVIPVLPDMKEAKWCYGLDFGLVNPSALIKIYQLENRFYLEERLYKAGMDNADIIEFLSHEEKGDIYGDPTEKQMVEEIFRAGYNIYEGHKGVTDGINLCKRQILNIPEASVNLIKEIQSYQWKENKKGEVIEEPVKFNDHLMDAMRYGIYGMTERYGFATASPGSMKPRTKKPTFSFG